MDKLELENDTIKFTRQPKLIFIPDHKIQDVLKLFHDDPLSGHLAYDKTLNRIKVRFFWFDMKKHIKIFCESCVVCQQFRVFKSKNLAELKLRKIRNRPN